MNLREMMDEYSEEGLTRELAAARVCQDIVLKAIVEGPFSRNVTIKGGVVMRSLTQNNRRATQDIDLDFIHYSLDDASIRSFVEKLNCIDGITIEIQGEIKVLKHQDYHGKSIEVVLHDEFDNMFYLKDIVSKTKLLEIMELLIFSDDGMFEKNMSDIIKRVSFTFKDEQYLRRVSGSRQRWLDNDIHEIASGIISYLGGLK